MLGVFAWISIWMKIMKTQFERRRSWLVVVKDEQVNIAGLWKNYDLQRFQNWWKNRRNMHLGAFHSPLDLSNFNIFVCSRSKDNYRSKHLQRRKQLLSTKDRPSTTMFCFNFQLLCILFLLAQHVLHILIETGKRKIKH